MTVQEFFNKYNGRGIDWDQYYGYQCVDLYRQYCHEVLELPQSPGVVRASDIWDTYLKDQFERIKNDPDAVPQTGDIVIWNKNAGGGYGHVAIYNTGDINSFVSFDQNWPVGSLCHFQPHNYTNVLGWLRPKGTETSPEPPGETKQLVTDILLALKENTSDNEIDAWVAKFVNPKQMIEEILNGDFVARDYWLDKWEMPRVIEKEVIKEVEVVKEVVKVVGFGEWLKSLFKA